MRHVLGLLIVAGVLNLLPSSAQALPFGDVNGNGTVNVIDVQLMIKMSLGLPLGPVLDADGDGIPDQYAANTDQATCGVNPEEAQRLIHKNQEGHDATPPLSLQ